MGEYTLALWQHEQRGPCLCQRKRVGGDVSLGALGGMAQLALPCSPRAVALALPAAPLPFPLLSLAFLCPLLS